MSVNPTPVGLSSAAVDHDEIRSLLSTYAAGQCRYDESQLVREHLASGCADCLRALYSYPVGLPRATPAESPEREPEPDHEPEREPEKPPSARPISPATVTVSSTTPAQAPPAQDRQRLGPYFFVALVALLALVLTPLAAWTISNLRTRETMARNEAIRLAGQLRDAEAARSAVEARVAVTVAERDAARLDAARQLDASREAAETNGLLTKELESLQTRVDMLLRDLQRREQEIDRLLIGADERSDLRELLATPGVEILHLKPMAPFRDVIGHVLFHPTRTAIVLYAFDLPAAPVGDSYRIRLGLDDAEMENGPTFRPGPRGDVALPLRLRVDAAHLREVEVVLDPPGEAVLSGSRSPTD
jgi:hypothetical protein